MPEEFGPYRLEEEIGRGGMGVVYRAYDTRRDRQVALKRLPRDLSADATFQARFRRESRLAARLNEPHIIPIHDFGEIDGVLYLDMRLVDGTDLSSLIRAGSLTPALAVEIVGQVASALTSAHEAGLVHRDVKPSNVLISSRPGERGYDADDVFAYLVDFGIARGRPGTEGSALTVNTETVGTLAYMAPERISGGSGDHRSDIYSLACLLFECLTGRTPFAGEPFQVMYAHVHTAPPAPSNARPELPAGIDAVIVRGMAKNPDERYPSARQFAAAARSALATRPVPPAPPAAPMVPPRPMAPPAPPPPPPPPPLSPLSPPNWSSGAPPHPSGPLPRPPGPSTGPVRRPRSRRTLIAVVIAVVLVLTGGIAVAVALAGGDPDPQPSSSRSPVVTTGSSHDFPTSSPAPTSASASSATPDWADFDDFTKLVGSSDADTTATFKNAYCAIHGSDGTPGMVDRVECTAIKGSPVTYSVARFASGTALSTYVRGLTSSKGYQVGFWSLPKINKEHRGRLYTSPVTASFVDVTSSICALPTYLVQFFVPPGSNLSVQDVEDDYWAKARFPDSVPAPCS